MEYRYSDIINYFEAIAISSSDFQHTADGRVAFISSDITDLIAEEISSLSTPAMIAGFNARGLDNGISRFEYSLDDGAYRTYAFNLAIIKEVPGINQLNASSETLISLDEITDRLLGKVFLDRDNSIYNHTSICCFLKWMDPIVTIQKTVQIGQRQALGVVLNFNFKFKRTIE